MSDYKGTGTMGTGSPFPDKRPMVREAARNRKPLGGPDAQALEGALQQVERELDDARRRLAEATDLLHEWEASVTIESPPALAYRTSKFLHPEAYPEVNRE